MNNFTVKKQNRILLISIAITLAALALLIAITGSANKKSTSEEKPPLDGIKESDSGISENEPPLPSDKLESEAKPNETTAQTDDKKDASADRELHMPTSAPADVLPTFSVPTDGFVIKGYSALLPVFSYTMNDYRTHGGVDFAASAGSAVRAAADGTVSEITDDPMMGVTVAVKHSGGAVSYYKGLSEDSLSVCKVGDVVKAGEVIGAAGETALIESAEEPHLHFELKIDGKSCDPGEYMKLTYLSDMHED